jgi:hypothetical protein
MFPPLGSLGPWGLFTDDDHRLAFAHRPYQRTSRRVIGRWFSGTFRDGIVFTEYVLAYIKSFIYNIIDNAYFSKRAVLMNFTVLSQPLDPHLDPSGGMFHADVG